MLVDVEGSLVVGVVFSLGIFSMAVEVALIFICTLVFFDQVYFARFKFQVGLVVEVC